MIKTVTLTAGEVNSIEFGQRYPYYYIKNFSSADVYASIKKFVFIADEEEVTRIPAGSTGIVYGTLASEYVNILCTESVKIEVIGAFDGNINFIRKITVGGEGGTVDTYTKEETDRKITEKVAEIVAEAPEDFDTLKEISTWIDTHEDSAASMNLAIQENTTNIENKVDKKYGYSLVADTEIARLAEVKNYDDTQIKNDIALLQTGIYLYNKSSYGTFTEGYVMRIGNQVHINCKLTLTKAVAEWTGSVIDLPFAVKTPDDVNRYTIAQTQSDDRTTSIYINKGGTMFYSSTAFNVGDIIEIKGLILDMYAAETATTSE